MGCSENSQEAAELVSNLDDKKKSMRFEEIVENLSNRVLTGLQVYVRDVNLPEEIAGKYEEGMILRSPSCIYASSHNGGMVTSHRFTILSNHMADISAINGKENPGGIAAAECDAYFQVLKIYKSISGETMILLLHLPDDGSWQAFMDANLPPFDNMIDDCIDRFANELIEPPVKELTTAEWFECCAVPIGINENCSFVEL